jgi:hypothetical protein
VPPTVDVVPHEKEPLRWFERLRTEELRRRHRISPA